MNNPKKHVIIIAGEASGDMHAARLINEIKKKNQNIEFSGLGGPAMKTAGVELYEDLTKLAVVGFVEVLKHYPEIKRIFDTTLKKIKETRPDAVILVDYPGFNLRLAKAVKQLPSPPKIIYYISPQVWAWKESRVNLIRRCVDKMMVLFPFEKNFYARHGIDVEFTGHPFIDTIKVSEPAKNVREKLGLPPDTTVIGILPGSRKKEIEKMLPVMINAASIMKKNIPSIRFICLKAPTIEMEFIKKFLPAGFPGTVASKNFHNTVNACDACMVTSGTATLETALLEKPMVVLYKISFLTWLIARSVIKLPYISLVNVIAGKQIVPELVQFDASPENIAQTLEGIIKSPEQIRILQSELSSIKKLLGNAGAVERAAEVVLQEIG